jgi:adenosylhomocysteine nucleosidase
MRPAFLVGLDFEAAILRQAAGTDSPLVAIARQGDVAATRARLNVLIDRGADAIASFGIAGALDPALEVGTLVMPDVVFDMDAGAEGIATDEAWRSSLLAAGPVATRQLASVATPVTTPAQKAQLHNETGAVAVDMESAIAGRLAAEKGLPFLVVRAIADDARLALPAAALAGVDPDGSVRPLATVVALLRRPGEISALIRLARATAQARRRLAAIAPKLAGSR